MAPGRQGLAAVLAPTAARRHFRPLVEDRLGIDASRIAWTNLTNCRVAIHPGSRKRSAESKLTRLCHGPSPVSALVAVLGAPPGGRIVASWDSDHPHPVVDVGRGQVRPRPQQHGPRCQALQRLGTRSIG
jgi:hypothetical protein